MNTSELTRLLDIKHDLSEIAQPLTTQQCEWLVGMAERARDYSVALKRIRLHTACGFSKTQAENALGLHEEENQAIDHLIKGKKK